MLYLQVFWGSKELITGQAQSACGQEGFRDPGSGQT